VAFDLAKEIVGTHRLNLNSTGVSAAIGPESMGEKSITKSRRGSHKAF